MSDTGVDHRVRPLIGQVKYEIPKPEGRGRPPKSNYDRMDEPLYAEMFVLLIKARVANVTEAARAVADRAYNCRKSDRDDGYKNIAKRLIRGFWRWLEEFSKLPVSAPYGANICLYLSVA